MSGASKQEPDMEARSPWSQYKEWQEVAVIPPSLACNGTIKMPGSKSMTNRALIIASLAEGTSRLDGILKSDDSYWCINSLRQLGIRIETEQDSAIVRGAGGSWPVREVELYAGAAGTVARFLPGALAAGVGSWTLTGSRRMTERPLGPLLHALVEMGAEIRYGGAPECLPLTLVANGIRGGKIAVSGSTSSQFISGLLLAAPYAKEPLQLMIEDEVVQRDYVEMTLRMMADFGVEASIQVEGRAIEVPQGAYRAQSYRLEPDVSTCCYFWALAALTNGRIRTDLITKETLQPDIELLDVLERMGCTVVRGDGFIEVSGTERLRGGLCISMKRWSDQTLTVAVLAAFADAPITMTDAAHIRHHECDRISAICSELRKLGIRADEYPDGITVYPGQPQPALLDPHDDHRMAMAFSLIGTRVDGIRIANPGCVSKTCPDFFDRLKSLGVGIVFGHRAKGV